MVVNTFSTQDGGKLPDSYLNLSIKLLNEVTDTTIHFDLINPKDANGTLYNHTVFGDIGSKGINLFYFKNHKQPNIII